MGITTLLLSVVNTFFKPYTQLTDNQALKDIGRNAVENPILYEKETQGGSYILNRDESISLGNGVGKTPIEF